MRLLLSSMGILYPGNAKHLIEDNMAYSASGHVEAMMRSDWLTERSEFSALSRKNRFCFGHILNQKLSGIGLVYLFTSTSFNSLSIKTPKKAILTSRLVNNAIFT